MANIRTMVIGARKGYEHALAYHLSDKAELVWIADLDEERGAKAAADFGCGYTADWRKALADVDAVSIATPHHLHAPMALEAIAAGKHVLVEKPLATTEEDGLRLIRAAEDQGVVLMVGYNLRFRPEVQRLKEAIEREEYGKPFSAQCWTEVSLRPKEGSWLTRKETLGGGVLFSHGCHYIDLLQWLLGQPVQAAGVGTRLGTEWLEGEGTHHSILKFAGGAIAHLTTSWGMAYRSTPAILQVHTPQACLILSGRKLEAVAAGGRKTLLETPVEGKIDDSVIGEVDHFLDCIRSGRTPSMDGREGLRSLRLVWSIYEQESRLERLG